MTYRTPLNGDVFGAPNANNIVKIQGITLSGTPEDGYSLVVTTGGSASWQSPDGYVTLTGDVEGAANSNSVTKIQGTPVSTNSVVHDGYSLVSTGGTYVPTGVVPVYNVKNFGAKGDGVTDDTVAIQLALNTVPSPSELYFPLGHYLITSPLIMANSINLSGSSGATIVQAIKATGSFTPNNWVGPALIVGGAVSTPETITQQSGIYCINALASTLARPILDFTEYSIGNLNGLSAFTFECYINAGTGSPILPGNRFYIAASSGSRGPSSDVTAAFSIAQGFGNSLICQLTTTSGIKTFGTVGTLPTNTLVHIAFTYDGSNIRVFINGVLNAGDVHAWTGTIVQNWWEDFTVGFSSGLFPTSLSLGSFNNTGTVAIGSIRTGTAPVVATASGDVSDPTTSFSPPTTEMTTNTTTLILVNFDPANILFGGSWIIAKSFLNPGGGYVNPIYMYLNHDGNDGDAAVSCVIQNLTISCNNAPFGSKSIYAPVCLYLTIKECMLTGAEPLTILGGYGHLIDHCTLSAGIWTAHSWCFGIYEGPGGDLVKLTNCFFSGGRFSVVTSNGLYAENNFGIYCPSVSGFLAIGAVANSNFIVLINNIWDDEGSPSTDSGCILYGCTSATLIGNSPPGSGSLVPMYKIGDCGAVSINDAWCFNPNAGFIQFIAPMNPGAPPVTINTVPLPNVTSTPILDPSFPGALIVPQWEQFGVLTYNFTSNATFNLGGNDQLFGCLMMTDTGVVLTGTTAVVYPYLTLGYRRRVVNRTAQTLTFGGPTGGTVSVTTNTSATIFCNGTDWISI